MLLALGALQPACKDCTAWDRGVMLSSEPEGALCGSPGSRRCQSEPKSAADRNLCLSSRRNPQRPQGDGAADIVEETGAAGRALLAAFAQHQQSDRAVAPRKTAKHLRRRRRSRHGRIQSAALRSPPVTPPERLLQRGPTWMHPHIPAPPERRSRGECEASIPVNRSGD